jgi:hypothetical protein
MGIHNKYKYFAAPKVITVYYPGTNGCSHLQMTCSFPQQNCSGGTNSYSTTFKKCLNKDLRKLLIFLRSGAGVCASVHECERMYACLPVFLHVCAYAYVFANGKTWIPVSSHFYKCMIVIQISHNLWEAGNVMVSEHFI